LTQANLTSSALFTTLHFTSHAPLWAIGVLLPSLLFGYFRDRHDSIYPAIVLHIFYNAGYFLLL
jgi:membrane protease YdiL (CAAX protease family)